MSAKEEFFKRVQENSETEKDTAVRVKEDVQHFQAAMDALSLQVQEWMSGSGVEVQAMMTYHTDQSIAVMSGSHTSRYEVASVRMKNQDRTAELKAIGVYGGGARGWASLTVSSPRRSPSTEKFQLRRDRETEQWIIRRENQKTAEGSPLNEETFFQAISAIA